MPRSSVSTRAVFGQQRQPGGVRYLDRRHLHDFRCCPGRPRAVAGRPVRCACRDEHPGVDYWRAPQQRRLIRIGDAIFDDAFE